MENVNLVTMFILPTVTAIYGVWVDDWRPFHSAAILGLAVLVFGLCIIHNRDGKRKEVPKKGTPT
jgi:membrane protein YdbS with pleckstrin-like domain